MTRQSRPLLALTASCLFLIAIACSKSNSNSNAITKENIAGSYTLTAITASVAGLPPQNIMDSIPACQRDDIYKLNLDYSFDYIDAGTVCVPPGDDVSTWGLSGNKLIIGSDTANITSFNGKTLVVNSTVTILGISASTTETFTKQ